jgi:hypothetical protein
MSSIFDGFGKGILYGGIVALDEMIFAKLNYK